jgi:glycosyltransferase involved in cell wall biosynthesis
MRTVSIVSPCYNEQDNLSNCFEALKDLQTWHVQKGLELEVIIVDDGSRDNSRNMIWSFCSKNPWAKGVFNSRNFGVYRTAYHGLRYCRGQWIVPMFPVDLQDPPEVLKKLIEAKAATNAAAVMGRKIGREESPVMAGLRKLFYLIAARLSSYKLQQNAGEFGVLDRWIVEELLRRDDYYPFLRGMIANITADIVTVDYVWQRRTAGVSKHNLVLLYDHAMNGLISTGRSFIRPIVIFGFLVGFSSFVFAFFNVLLWILNPSSFAISGLPTLIVGLFFLMGVLFMALGLLGEYVVAIHAQVRGYDRVLPAVLLNIEPEHAREASGEDATLSRL